MTEASPARATSDSERVLSGGPLPIRDELDPEDRAAVRAAARGSVTGYGPLADALRLERERDEARAERDKAVKLNKALERILRSWVRGMYSARIDCVRGDVKAAIETLAESLDGYDGTGWDGKETGAQWWERTKAEEAAQGEPGDEGTRDAGVLADLLSLIGVTVTPADVEQWTAEQRIAARDWSVREHLHASDNPVERVPKPQFLSDLQVQR